jgi:hypothetical protein
MRAEEEPDLELPLRLVRMELPEMIAFIRAWTSGEVSSGGGMRAA